MQQLNDEKNDNISMLSFIMAMLEAGWIAGGKGPNLTVFGALSPHVPQIPLNLN